MQCCSVLSTAVLFSAVGCLAGQDRAGRLGSEQSSGQRAVQWAASSAALTNAMWRGTIPSHSDDRLKLLLDLVRGEASHVDRVQLILAGYDHLTAASDIRSPTRSTTSTRTRVTQPAASQP